MEDCIYCKITEKREPSTIIDENSDFCAFLAPYPVNPGHIILTPNEHHNSLTSLSDEQYSQMHLQARKLAKALIKTDIYDGFNLMYKHGECAGQDCSHACIHIIPRVGTDGFYLNWRQQPKLSDSDSQELADTIRQKLNS
jgi:histidine triad (HIT) family protein